MRQQGEVEEAMELPRRGSRGSQLVGSTLAMRLSENPGAVPGIWRLHGTGYHMEEDIHEWMPYSSGNLHIPYSLSGESKKALV